MYFIIISLRVRRFYFVLFFLSLYRHEILKPRPRTYKPLANILCAHIWESVWLFNYWTWIITQVLFSFFASFVLLCVCFAVFPAARTLLRRLCHFNKLPKQRHKNNVCFGTKKTGKSHVVVCCDTLTDITVSDVYVCVCIHMQRICI